MKRDPDFTENFRNGHAACWSWASRQQRVVRRASRRVVVFLSRHWPAGSKELCAEFQEGLFVLLSPRRVLHPEHDEYFSAAFARSCLLRGLLHTDTTGVYPASSQ